MYKLPDNYTPLFKLVIRLLLAVILIMSILITALVMQGCHVVEINMVQRSIIDDGDGTNDRYSKTGDDRVTREEETTEFVVPLK